MKDFIAAAFSSADNGLSNDVSIPDVLNPEDLALKDIEYKNEFERITSEFLSKFNNK